MSLIKQEQEHQCAIYAISSWLTHLEQEKQVVSMSSHINILRFVLKNSFGFECSGRKNKRTCIKESKYVDLSPQQRHIAYYFKSYLMKYIQSCR
ncbi:unnamed protein product (macronuclear) [Paramecium tetraurelia]|uniref:Ubiquitinyl hydrolase 1 n=1 Tax=Paramecium tetraurelia TaxID=5888 RepID=A0D2V8_PARTE|nr:uncharacterized protein GSPATT00039202001 [Paramecium tetraurelia]CAK77375.1 unnamed protein product [Paramecium tetraurelia]|eukprot:XP_001444772.1 hypothetical protein (macronuclear) [Paramecium tetraurelia strain d4-2]